MPKSTCRYCKTKLDSSRASCGVCLNCATATKLCKMMEWHKFTNAAEIPVGELCLFVVSSYDRDTEVHSGAMHRDGNGNPLGNIGGRFHFDWTKIHQWVSIQHLVSLADAQGVEDVSG